MLEPVELVVVSVSSRTVRQARHSQMHGLDTSDMSSGFETRRYEPSGIWALGLFVIFDVITPFSVISIVVVLFPIFAGASKLQQRGDVVGP